MSHGILFSYLINSSVGNKIKTDLNERDEDDEEGRWTTRITIGVIFALPIVRQELVGNHLHHSEFKTGTKRNQ